MGNYTRKPENYARHDRSQNTPAAAPQKPATVVHTCWKCHKTFELPAPTKTDNVQCPYCEMVHGLITSK